MTNYLRKGMMRECVWDKTLYYYMAAQDAGIAALFYNEMVVNGWA